MSVSNLIAAMRSDLPPAARLVWMCLENHANSAGFWSITNSQIAAELHLGIATVKRSVWLLESRSVIRRDVSSKHLTVFHMNRGGEMRDQNDPPSKHNGGSNRSLVQKNGGSKRSLIPKMGDQKDTPSGKMGDQIEPPESTSKNPPVRAHQIRPSAVSSRAARRRESEPDGFADFYDRYPRKAARRAAAKAFAGAIRRGATLAEILAGLERHRFSDDPQYQPHPATWLNQNRWLDEPAEPKRGFQDEFADALNLPSFVPSR